ncbi:hypothetical protein [Elstera cyanobacteriorum]|uniref:hypothetical protein n=1 Tax=Elstera cyanobacteriorum TaxID=2022747 RepID=UPI002354A25E|nr:hypothetical protein [Elstera cyanobacteriorum]MCK6444410.1 hypothetical protein [Elstera cyanobacteriorum]
MLETLTPPAPDLVTMLEVLEFLGIPISEQDPALAGYISRASATVISEIGYSPNRGVYRQSIETQHGLSALPLARLPVASVTAVTLNGEALDPAQYQVESEAGLLVRIAAGLSRRWEPRTLVVVEYAAGFDPLPQDIKLATLKLVETGWAARGRDPGLRNIGIGSISLGYFAPDASAPGIASVADLLSPYRQVRVG